MGRLLVDLEVHVNPSLYFDHGHRIVEKATMIATYLKNGVNDFNSALRKGDINVSIIVQNPENVAVCEKTPTYRINVHLHPGSFLEDPHKIRGYLESAFTNVAKNLKFPEPDDVEAVLCGSIRDLVIA